MIDGTVIEIEQKNSSQKRAKVSPYICYWERNEDKPQKNYMSHDCFQPPLLLI